MPLIPPEVVSFAERWGAWLAAGVGVVFGFLLRTRRVEWDIQLLRRDFDKLTRDVEKINRDLVALESRRGSDAELLAGISATQSAILTRLEELSQAITRKQDK